MAILKDLIVQGNSRFIGDTNLGIVKSGVWNGSTIDVSYGGTGVTSIAALFNLIRDNGGDNRWLKLSGGTMTGTVQWSGAAALPEQTNPLYFLCVDSFSSGGTTKWSDISLIKNLVEKTWSQLKAMRDGGTLIPGQQYRITDYTCTTTQADTSTAGHVFDIIVVADTASKLNENARAVAHSGDTYFANCKLEAWELKYCIDNDTNRFAWADSTNGKGVIFYMKDEFGNICGYDFKNILMKFYKITAVTTVPSALNNTYSVSKVIDTDNYTITSGCTVDANDTEFRYTFDLYLNSTHSDYSLNTASSNKAKFCYDNVITPMYGFTNTGNSAENKKMWINFISFRNTSNDNACYGNKFGAKNYNMSFGYSCFSNTFGNNCYSNTFGDGCYSNTFGNNCYSNAFGDGCYSNTFGDGCSSNTFAYDCVRNTFGEQCYSNTLARRFTYNTFGNYCYSNSIGGDSYSNTLGNYCYSNKIGSYCSSNTFGNSCSSNTFGSGGYGYYCCSNSFGNECKNNMIGSSCSVNSFGNECKNNTLGDVCNSNTFGNGCQYIKFGNSSSAKSYYEGIIVENLNEYIYLDTTQTTSSSNKIKNVKIAQGVNNTTTYKTISHNTVNDAFQTVYQSANSVIVSV